MPRQTRDIVELLRRDELAYVSIACRVSSMPFPFHYVDIVLQGTVVGWSCSPTVLVVAVNFAFFLLSFCLVCSSIW